MLPCNKGRKYDNTVMTRQVEDWMKRLSNPANHNSVFSSYFVAKGVIFHNFVI
jgi:hypothetical protein